MGVRNFCCSGGEEQPGNPEVYAGIAAMNDCAVLQAEFDQADENHAREKAEGDLKMMEIATSYMKAVDERMREVGCYEDES